MNVHPPLQRSFRLEPAHPKPEQAHTMPYAPAVHIVGACGLMFLSGAPPSPLYHKHPHVEEEHVHPHSIEEQTTRAMEAIKSILDYTGATWCDVVKVTKYLTDFHDADAMRATMAKYFGDWRPASTTVCINQLSSPGARIELNMIVALPKKASWRCR
jgi:2-iminobutanoate/2-iminopropanoate deaminase